MSTPPDRLRAAIQGLLDEIGDGWSLAQFVVAMGIERMKSDGSVDSQAWYWTPRDQPEWMTNGLLDEVMDMRTASEPADDD